MAFPLTHKELEKELVTLLSQGLGGNASDFCKWIRMEILKKFKDEPSLTKEDVASLLDSFKSSNDLVSGRFDPQEYFLSPNSKFNQKVVSKDSYNILGGLEYSPLQYVKSRLEYFLRRNLVNDEEVVDISIATTEAVENAVKYGDGKRIEVEYNIDRAGMFNIFVLNNIKDFNLEDDIKRGKFSSTATLMRGLMVMQKLFHHVDLEIIEDKKQARLQASRNIIIP